MPTRLQSHGVLTIPSTEGVRENRSFLVRSRTEHSNGFSNSGTNRPGSGGGWVTVTGRLSIPTADGPLVYENVSSGPLKSASHAPPIETAASSSLLRCCAMAGLGLQLWEPE